MLPIIILLISALTFQKIASEMKMTEFFVNICKPFMAGSVFPMITFIIVGLLAFMIANAWGVCTLVAPVLIPLGASVGANIVLVMAAILSGVHSETMHASTVTQQCSHQTEQELTILSMQALSCRMCLSEPVFL